MPPQRDGKGLLLTEFFGPETFDQGAAFVGQPWSDVMHPQFAGGADPTGARSSLPAFQAALNSVVGAGAVCGILNIPAIVNGVVANYTLDGPLVLPSGGTDGLVIQGNGMWSPRITVTGGASFLSAAAGYHIDLTVKGLWIQGATDAIKFTTGGSIVRLVLENIQFFSCTNAIRSDAASLVGFTFRNLLFSGCGGDNIKCNPLYQFGPGLLDDCWFQAGAVPGFSSYINASYVGNIGGDGWTLLRPIFEGGIAGPALILGTVSQWKFEGAVFADFNDTGTLRPLIQTVGVNAHPQRAKFTNCDLENAGGPIIQLGGAGGSMVRAGFDHCLIVGKPGADPFNLGSANATQWEFEGCQITPAQSNWKGASVRYIECQEAGLDTGMRALNSSDSKGVAAQTLAANGAVAIAANNGSIAAITLQANATSSSITGTLWVGLELTIEWIQDGAGARTYAWPSNCKFAGAAAPTPSAGANRRDSVSFRCDGTNFIETSRAVNVG